jgi:hypothetical protein
MILNIKKSELKNRKTLKSGETNLENTWYFFKFLSNIPTKFNNDSCFIKFHKQIVISKFD